MPLPTIDRLQQEQPQFVLRGPFGGIQTEMPKDAIESFGFEDSLNFLLRNGAATTRPGNIYIDPLPGPPTGIADFYDRTGRRHTVGFCSGAMFDLVGSSWVLIPGMLGGTNNEYFSWTVVNDGLLFSQGVDPVQVYDGITNAVVLPSLNSVPAMSLLELNTHLLCLNTFEGGEWHTQRVRWTAAGNYEDWTGFNTGFTDLLNSLGPIVASAKIFENGFALHKEGFTRIIPTGIGTRPFQFVPFQDYTKGCFFPNSVASYGNNGIAYASRNDILHFDGSSFESIGAMPIADSRYYSGARNAIVAELLSSDPSLVFGFNMLSFGQLAFESYWLIIPGKSTWVFNYVERSWTRFQWGVSPRMMGLRVAGNPVTIGELVGTIAEQTWIIGDGPPSTGFDRPVIGFSDGSMGLPDAGELCESASIIKSGSMVMGDHRHNKKVERFNISYIDLGAATISITFTNEYGVSLNSQVNIGGSGDSLLKQYMFSLPNPLTGMYIRWQILVQPNNPVSIIELSPIYSISGEYKN